MIALLVSATFLSPRVTEAVYNIGIPEKKLEKIEAELAVLFLCVLRRIKELNAVRNTKRLCTHHVDHLIKVSFKDEIQALT